jgi:iron(II)-dependent oxidoreductase
MTDLVGARERTLAMTDLDEPELLRQHDPLMSPLVWDLAHIGQQEDLWLLRGGDARRQGLLPPAVEELYDAFRHARAERPLLPLLPPVEARAFCYEVRGRILDRLERSRGEDAELFPYAMVAQHELQHGETMLATLQLRQGPPVLVDGPLPRGRTLPGDRVLVPGGEFRLGVDALDEPWSLDNERPSHVVDVAPFWIGRVPVTNGEWADFIADGGYDQPRWWSARGWS